MAIIYIYDSTATDFTYNGQPLNKAYEVVVDNMINDSFFVTFNHPLDDKGIYKTIEKDKIVKVHTPDGMQPFRVMDRVKYMDHVSIEAWPLFYADMRNKLVRPLAIRGLSGQAAMSAFVNNLLIYTPFTFTSNIIDVHDYHTQDAEQRESNPNQLYNALDVFKDIVARWKGELVINGYDVRVVNRLGKNTGALLYEKKNISDFTDEESIQDITTRLYGKSEWTERPEGSDEEVKHEISVKVESPLINAYSGIVFEKQYTNNDIRTEKEMRDWLNLKFTTDNIDKPSRNIKVGTNIVDDTVISMGDSLVLKYVKHDVDMEIRMVGYTYDGYANRYITIQLGDAKQSYVGNVQNTVREIETNVNTNVKQTVNQILNANGERMIYSVTKPIGNFKNGDVWFDQQGGMYFWDEEKGMWIDHPYNRNMNVVAEKVDDAEKIAGEAIQAAKDADTKANDALTKAGANAELLTTHQNTIDTINNTTIPAISSTAGTALANAKSAMDEAKLADGKIADYVTRNGLVSGTTVDSKINEATGEISKKITTVESKIPTEFGGRNLIANTEFPSGYLNTYLNFGVMSSTYSGSTPIDTFNGQTTIIPKGEDYVVSFYAKASANVQTFCYFYNPNSTTQAVSSTGQTSSAINGAVGVSITTEWQRYWVRWKQNPANTTTKKSLIIGRNMNVPNGTVVDIAGVKLEQGTIPSDWTAAEEDNYTQEEFSIFESTYNETVKGINTSLIDLSTKKLDGSTYTTFYDNEYKKTAQGVTDTWEAVNKIIDENGNTTDTFAKAVYDRNAQRQTADFKLVTNDLVTTTTYTDDVRGINNSIATIQGDIKSLADGGTNLITGSDKVYTQTNSSFLATDGININELIGGEEYTFSFDIRSSTATYISSLFINNSINGLIPNSPIGTEWTRLSSKFKWVEGSNYGEFDIMPHFYPGNDYSGTHEVKNVKLEKGGLATPWTPALEDMLGKSDFQVFKGTYELNDKDIKARLLAIDSSDEGSVVTRLNKTESTASGNSQTIATINKNYVKQSNIDASILADKKIKDTRNANQLPSWYFSNYPLQEVREFKLVSTMGIGSGTYGILTTNVPWAESSGGTVKQTFETNAGIHTRQGNSAGTAWGAWVKQIDTADTTYQKITQTSSLYERVLGSTDETGVKGNISRIVQTSGVIQSEVASAVPNPNLLSGTDFKEGLGDVGVYNRTPTLSETSYFPYGKVATIDTPETSGSANLGFIVKVPKKDTWYTLSFYGSTDWVGSNGVSFYSLGLNSSKNYKTPVVIDSPLIHKIQITFQVSQDDDLLYVRPQGNAFGDYANIVFYGVKLEVGEVATPWENSDPASSSKITQLANSLIFKVSKEDLLSQINVQANSVLIQSGTNKLNVTPETTYIEDSTIKSAMIESLEADKITTGTLDGKEVNVINLNAENITGNRAKLIQAGFESSSGGSLALDGDQILSTASDGSQVYLQKGIVGVRRPSKEGGGTIGQIGYVYDGGSPTYTIQTAWGAHFALKQRFYDTYTKATNEKRAMYISTGDNGETTMQFYAKDFVLQGNRNLRFGYDHYINGIGNDLTLTGKASVTLRANERTVFVVSSNGEDNFASLYANLNMQGRTLTNTSDIRLKRDIVNDEIDSLSALMKWQHAGFNYINPDMNQDRQYSVIAQSAPDLSSIGEDGYLQVSLNKQVNMTSHALQQHVVKTNDEITKLKSQIASLQDELATLKGA